MFCVALPILFALNTKTQTATAGSCFQTPLLSHPPPQYSPILSLFSFHKNAQKWKHKSEMTENIFVKQVETLE
jgi:hypothetical protein